MRIRMRHLISDFSKDEAPFFKDGTLFIGESNELTDLFKFVGRYIELKSQNQLDELAFYNPKTDNKFKYENMGYTEIKRRLDSQSMGISRRYLVSISRKWSLSRVALSYDTVPIINELYKYIWEDINLRNACATYITGNSTWDEIMPIQFRFLAARQKDKHHGWKIAESIVNQLSTFSVGDNIK